jgi:twinkle protein
MKSFADYGIQIPLGANGPEVFLQCPQCSSSRTKSRVKCLSVNIEKNIWCCHHCAWAGSLKDGEQQAERRTVYPKPSKLLQVPLTKSIADWFHARAITGDVLKRNQIEPRRVYMPQLEDFVEAVAFPYFRNGELINIKYRSIPEKHFRLEPQCELILYGLDDIRPDEPLIWVEGECDKLALEVAGFKNVVSVPNGAPPPEAKNYSALLKFLEADEEKIQSVKSHILAVDSDVAGRYLETELARRLGIERCSRVRWPELVKDANEMLVKHGAIDLAWYVDNAENFPLEGVFGPSDCRDELDHLYEHGFEKGLETGWAKIDELYTVAPRQVTVVTGIPSSGKSNFIDCLLVNLARLHGWNFALFSPENLPLEEHMAAIAEKYIGKPFHEGPTPRMSRAEFERAKSWIEDHFKWISPNDADDWTVDKILTTASQLCLRRGIHGVVIDPWNELESTRPSYMTETEFISQSLKRIGLFALRSKVHVWIVVHPAKLYRGDSGKYPVPSLYDCSGSAHWRNKADNGIVVWRDLSDLDSNEVEIHVQRIRFRHIGRHGVRKLYYDKPCATYSEYGLSNGKTYRDWTEGETQSPEA